MFGVSKETDSVFEQEPCLASERFQYRVVDGNHVLLTDNCNVLLLNTDNILILSSVNVLLLNKIM